MEILPKEIKKVLAGDQQALLNAFVWVDSPEGWQYWANVCDTKPLPEEARAKLEALLAKHAKAEALTTQFKRPRGFAAMPPERQREIAAKGGRSVPDEKRSFSQNPDLAREAGRKGGKAAPAAGRSFSRDRALAQAAGKKSGRAKKLEEEKC